VFSCRQLSPAFALLVDALRLKGKPLKRTTRTGATAAEHMLAQTEKREFTNALGLHRKTRNHQPRLRDRRCRIPRALSIAVPPHSG
jgi:hypothetical protein